MEGRRENRERPVVSGHIADSCLMAVRFKTRRHQKLEGEKHGVWMLMVGQQ